MPIYSTPRFMCVFAHLLLDTSSCTRFPHKGTLCNYGMHIIINICDRACENSYAHIKFESSKCINFLIERMHIRSIFTKYHYNN